MNRDACLRIFSSRGAPRSAERGVTTLLVLVVLASLILGGTVGAWMRVVSTRTSGQAVSTSRGIACAEAGLAAARSALFTGVLPAGTVLVNGVGAVGPAAWKTILAGTWSGAYNRPFLSGTIGAPATFVAMPATWSAPPADFKPLTQAGGGQPPLPLTFEVALGNNAVEYPTWGGAAINPASPVLDRDGLFIVTSTCKDPSIPYPIVVQRYLRHPDTKSPGANGGSTPAP